MLRCDDCGATFPETGMYWHHASTFHGRGTGVEFDHERYIGKKLGIVTGCCHFNENGACLDHKGGRRTSNFCTVAHELVFENKETPNAS